MSSRSYNVLFLCTGNSARSILAEALINLHVDSRFNGFSAGSLPKGQVHPLALQLLEQKNISTQGLRSKSWNEFATPGVPTMDFVFTVCDNAAVEVCPIWPGQPITAHWGVEDPAALEGTDKQKMEGFKKALRELENRIRLFVSLPIDKLEHTYIKQRVAEIGRKPTSDTTP